jgi:hypothetical protein
MDGIGLHGMGGMGMSWVEMRLNELEMRWNDSVRTIHGVRYGRKQKNTHSTNTTPRTSQTNSINSLTHTNSHILLLVVLVQSNKELRVHGSNEPVQHPVVVFENDWRLV